MASSSNSDTANATRRGKSTSYKARLTSLSAVKNEGDSALEAMREDRTLLVSAGNQAHLIVGKMLTDLQRIIALKVDDEWCVDEDSKPIVAKGTALRVNNVLLADMKNAWIGIKMLERIIEGQDRAIESLIEHADELAESIRPRVITKMRSLIGEELPLGFNKEQYAFFNPEVTARNEKGLEQHVHTSEREREHVVDTSEARLFDPPRYETTPANAPTSTASAAAAAMHTPRYSINTLP